MEIFLTKSSDKIVPLQLTRVGDLINYEGPLLALFEEALTSNLYLFDWVDRDKETNRWMVYTTSADLLLQFTAGSISHYDLFDSRPDKSVFYTDLGANDRMDNYSLYKLNEVPPQYHPNRDSYFDLLDCPDYSQIKTTLSSHLFYEKQKHSTRSVAM